MVSESKVGCSLQHSTLVESRRRQWELCYSCDYTKVLTFPWERDQRDSGLCTSHPSFKTLRVAWGLLLFFCALTLQFGFKNAEETFHAVSSEVPSFLDSSTHSNPWLWVSLLCVVSCSASAPEALLWPSSTVLVHSHEWQHEHLLLLSHLPELCLLQARFLAAPPSPTAPACPSPPAFLSPVRGDAQEGLWGAQP